MGRGLRRFLELIVPAALVVFLLASSWTPASATIVAMAGDSAVGKNSLALPGSQDILKDALGKYVPVYVDVPMTLSRDLGGNIVSVSYGSPTVLATSAQYPSAISTHDGGIVVTWNSAVAGVASSVFSLRWTLLSGWTNVADPLSRTPD